MRFWKKNKIFLLSFLLTLVCGGFLLAGFAYAQTDIYGLNPVSDNIGLGSDDIRLTIAKIIRAVLGLLGIIAIGIMLYGGFIYMTAGGNEERIGTAKKILINGVIGLVIILSSFSIAQFLINKLSQATFIPPGGGGDLCDDDIYALSHKDECFPELPNLCKGDNQPDWCCIADLEKSDVFIVKSITPVTDDTGINNVMIRAIFNHSVANDFTPDQVFDIKYNGQSVKGDFDFQFYADKQFVQATYKGEGTCFDEDKGEEVPCINFGDYDVVVNGDLTSKEGYKITEETDCGIFPLEAKFGVSDQEKLTKKKVLEFDGVNSYVDVGPNPLANTSFSLETWIYPSVTKNSYIFEVYPANYYLRTLNNGGLHFRMAETKDANGNPIWNACDVYTSPNMVSLNQWHHVVATFDISAPEKRQSIYLDGKLIAKTLGGKDYEGCKDFAGGGLLSIGAGLEGPKYDEPFEPFQGYMDSACIYNSAISSYQVKKHFNQGVGSCGSVGENGLLAGWLFNEGMGGQLNDYTGSGYTGMAGGTFWKDITLNTKNKVSDKIKPTISSWDIQGPKTDDGDLIPNKIYNLTADITDNSGLGFYNFKMNKKTYNAGGVVQEENIDLVDYLDGPRVSRGSDIPLANPFNFSYPVFTSKNPQKLILYTLTLNAFDIDSQRGEASYSYTLKPEHCINGVQDADETGIDSGGSCGGGPGDACLEDWQCSDGKCIDKKCVTYPKIIDVSPSMSGAEGNWLSILGKNFGEDEGKVEFALDKDGDEKISTEEWGEAIEANIVDKAGCGDTWTDKIIVVEVPSDLLIAVNSETSIRVVRADNSVLWDSTTDDYGNKPGTNKGWFTKNDIKLPGLCSVKTIEGAIAALPGVAIEAIGTAFGPDTNPQKALLFDKFEVPYSSWLNDKIQSQVPDINLFGKTAVSVLVDNKKSNAIKFEIISVDNEKNYYPTIQKIDPDSTTPGSMITISGSGFGSSGNIFISTSTSIALECAQTINQAVLPAECIKLEFTGFPEQCGNTWSNNQIIAKIPEDILPDNYYLALRNNYGYYTKAVGVKGEEDKDPLQVNDDEPLPGICLISPATGLAPLLNNPISIYGVNFSDLKKDIAVFFWQNTSTTVVNDITTWLGTNDEVVPEDSVQTVSVNKITTFIPYRESDGSSMQSGPIKVAVGSKISNGFKYTVKDCRQADAETIEFMEADEESGYQCCDAEGTPDVGKWKPNFYACIGESRSAGYVWRFTTGDIIAKPRVLEQCDWKNWSNSQSDGKYPSPTPSTLWSTGEKACVNAVMAVKFNVAIDHASINAENVKVFACGGGEEADCTVGVQIDPAELNFEMNGNTLEVRVIPPAPELNSNTWYRVELGNKIESAIKSQNVGELAPTQYTLEETRPCGEGTAYCFDFKTSNFDCQMTSAEIDPKTYTTHYLGKLFSPDGTPPSPFYYFVWGKSDQACIVISADQYKWDWDAPEDVLDIEFAPYKYNPNSTSRTSLTALKESPGVKVEAKANVFKQNNLEKYNIDALEEIGQLNGLKIASVDDIVSVDDFSGEDFTEFDNFTIDLEYTLDEVATSSMSVGDSQKGKFWYIHRAIYSQENGNYFILADRIFEDGFRMRELVSNLWEESPLVIYDSDKNSEDNWLSGKIKIEKQGNNLLIYDLINGNATESIYQIAMPAVVNDYGEKISFGALPAEDQVVNTLYGTINKFTIEKVNLGESIETEIIATNTTTIAISPPKILDYAPNCAEACVNSSIWAKFDQPMSVDSFSNNMKLYKCFDGEKCKLHPFQNIIDKSVSSDKYTFRSDLNPGILLEPKTWYVVKVFGGDTGVKAQGSLESGIVGRAMEEDFEWKFRTKDDPSPCKVDEVGISPNPFTAKAIGEQTKYSAIPKSSPDSCSSKGQQLNPWWYGWEWVTGDNNKPEAERVALVSQFKFGTGFSPGCNLGCVLRGSDVPTTTQDVYLCGNSVVDPGEDCDIGLDKEQVGISCSLDCLRLGNKNEGIDENLPQCGNGKVDLSASEECDPGGDKTDKVLWKYCSVDCLRTGSSDEYTGEPDVSWCGSGSRTDGEDCDIGLSIEEAKLGNFKLNISQVGCSDNCLHLGTKLAQSWCDNNPGYSECNHAISVCGNNELETGEECEVINDDTLLIFPTKKGTIDQKAVSVDNPEKYCNSQCQLQDICSINVIPLKTDDNLTGLRCDPETEGCNDDCTISGSSMAYKNASLCGDGKVGVGESGFCEEIADADAILSVNPIQQVLALGNGEVNTTTKKQFTTIEATVVSYFSIENNKKISNPLDTDAKATGSGDYFIKCGFEEYSTSTVGGLLNQCPIDLASDQNEFSLGVGENSCCYPRTYRTNSYPTDGDGLSNMPVCPNTLMEIDFNGEIDKDTLKNNFIIAVGHENVDISDTESVKYNCAIDDMKDVTATISPTLPTPLPELGKLDDNQGFFNKIWNFVKRFFVRIFSDDVFASNNQNLKNITVWCAGNITAEPKITPIIETSTVDGKKVETTVGSTVSFYLNNLLPKDSYIALYLKGGNQGITDVRGVGIKNAPPPANESNQLNDSIIFYTGSEVCKIFQVNVEPASYLFTQPFSTNFFTAFVKTASQQSIVPIEGVYYWDLDWQPQNHPIVDIPVAGYADYTSSTPMTIFGAKNLQGSLMAVANAKVTADITEGENHLGRVFTGFTKLEVNFCENPWPAVEDSGVWSPFEDSAYNFSMSYCADAGLSGDKFDDLPFLNYLIDLPIKTIQTQVQQVGYCEMSEVQTGTPGVTNAVPENYPSVPPQVKKLCTQDSECSKVYNLPYASNPTDIWNNGLCAPGSTTEELMNNNCTLYSFKQDQGYCMTKVGYPPQFGDQYTACYDNDNCGYDEYCFLTKPHSMWTVSNKCIGAGIQIQESTEAVFHLKDEVLKRYILFNLKNDDVIGVQILKNSAKGDEFEAKSIESWYGERFDNLAQMQKIEVAGYEGLTDGRDYYINALNETVNKKIYSNVYLLSINKEAQQGTLQVFEKLLNSLQFNINITDHGRCLADGVEPKNGLPTGNNINSITGFDCVTDFDCRDLFGLAIAGTNGVCSNAKTKLFRDWARLPKIKELQTKMEKMDKPELGSGTYLPGYTASKWPSWLGLFGVDKVDEINKWVGCGIGNKLVDSQTCWNAVSSTYHCPQFSSVYEYEYLDDSKSYLLHGPLEYFAVSSTMANYFIDLDHFTIQPWCEPTQVYSPFGQQCGDGIVNPNEKCDPPGKTEVSGKGFIPEYADVPGSCVGGIAEFKKGDECFSDFDCGLEWNTFNGYKVNSKSGTGLCVVEDDVVYNVDKFDSANPKQLIGFSCEPTSNDVISLCNFIINFTDAEKISYVGSAITYSANPDQIAGTTSLVNLVSKPEMRCAKLGDKKLHSNNNLFSGAGILQQPASDCEGVSQELVQGDFGSCPDYSKAYRFCDNQCQWQYASCKESYVCGNGIVEPGESCDDGVLNGKLGYCKKNCLELSYLCGDDEFQKDEKGNFLEFCELTDDSQNLYVRHFLDEGNFKKRIACNRDLALFSFDLAVNSVCGLNDTGCQAVIKPIFLFFGFDAAKLDCASFNKHCEKDPTLICADNNDCIATGVNESIIFSMSDTVEKLTADFVPPLAGSIQDFGPCVEGRYGKQYSIYKNNSCAWDCQNYGAYCGDKITQTNKGEDCDDGNDENQDGCSTTCLKENIACKQAGLYYVTSTVSGIKSTDFHIYKNKAGEFEAIPACVQKTNGNEICRAYGLTCKQTYIWYDDGNYNLVKEINQVNTQTSCQEDLSFILSNLQAYLNKYFSYEGIDTSDINKFRFKVSCAGNYTGEAGEVGDYSEQYCGNSIVDTVYTNKDSGQEIKEACDLGVKNGISCTPEYGKSCTYCSYDCLEILTIDSPAYCGNGQIDFISNNKIWEECDFKPDGSVVIGKLEDVTIGNWPNFTTVKEMVEYPASCLDQGQVKCANNCKKLDTSGCVNCFLKYPSDPGVIPKMSFVNVIAPNKANFSSLESYWPSENLSFKLFYGGQTPLESEISFINNNFSSSSFNYSKVADGFISMNKNFIGYSYLYHFFNGVQPQPYESLQINPDPICNKEGYYLQIGDATQQFDKEKALPFIVNGETQGEFVKRYYSIAPPAKRQPGFENYPLDNIFTIVIKKSIESGVPDFQGMVRNVGIKSDLFMSYVDIKSSYSNNKTFWSPYGYNNTYPNLFSYRLEKTENILNGIYIHDKGYHFSKSCSSCVLSVEDKVGLYSQAITIDTTDFGTKKFSNKSFDNPDGEKYRFIVDAINEAIGPYQDSDLKVEIYNTHTNPLQIYAPDSEFYIKDAVHSGNIDADYWYVFDLVEENGKYKVQKVQEVFSKWEDIMNSEFY